MVDLVYCPTDLLLPDIPLLYCYFSLSWSIILCLSSGDTYLSLGTSLSCVFVIWDIHNSTVVRQFYYQSNHLGEICSDIPNCLLGIKVWKTLEFCWLSTLLATLQCTNNTIFIISYLMFRASKHFYCFKN